MKIFDTAFGIHEKALTLRAQRMEVISQNIANADTPGFKARDIDFKNVLNDVKRAGPCIQRMPKHIGQAANAGTNMLYTVPFSTALDGNHPLISVLRHAKYGKAAAEYQATLRFIEGNIAGVCAKPCEENKYDVYWKYFGIAASAMNAQMVRMNSTASNMANAGTVGGSPDDAFKAKRPVFQALLHEHQLSQGAQFLGGRKNCRHGPTIRRRLKKCMIRATRWPIKTVLSTALM